MDHLDINKLNDKYRNSSPTEIIQSALDFSTNRIITTSFGIYSEVLLSVVSSIDDKIRVLWCDSLFNSNSTYNHANHLINKYNLNIHRYSPKLSKKEIKDKFNGVPKLFSKEHEKFSYIVKIEPFDRALTEMNPHVWFTNIRVRQNTYRDSKDIFSYSKSGILKVSPFYYWNDNDLESYVKTHNLSKNTNYYDPTKVQIKRECGIHFL